MSGRLVFLRRLLQPLAERPVGLGLVAAHVVFGVIVLIRISQGLEGAELQVYDRLVRSLVGQTEAVERGTPPIVMIGAEEADLNRYGWPLPDGTLAEALVRLDAAGATAIGVDIYRDRPRPPGNEALEAAYAAIETLVLIYLDDPTAEFAIPPPPSLVGTDKLGLSNIVRDEDGSVRRALVYIQSDDGEYILLSFPFMLAYRHLAAQGIQIGGDPNDPSQLMVGPTPLRRFQYNDGAYVSGDDGGYQVPLDFRDGFGAFPQYTLSALLDGEVPQEALAGKVVILGTTADSVKDDFFTPLAGPRSVREAMFGIELHAHAVSQFIRHGTGETPSRTVMSPEAEFAWIWMWCVIGGLIVVFSSHLWVEFLLILGAIGALTVISFQAFAAHFWVPLLPPAIGLATAGFGTAAILSYRARAMRRELMGMFSQHVSPSIAEALWDQRKAFTEDGRPSSQELTATILFSDLRGFSSISENMTPVDLTAWLNEYLDAMTEVVARHDGIVDKFVGDAVMAVFGIPIARQTEDEVDQDAVRAVECALDMGAVLESLNARWRAEGRAEIGMRVGVYTGPVVAGALGGRHRLSYTVIGDTVNTAARLESFDKSVEGDRVCRVLIGAATMERLGNRFALRRIGEVALKGKAQTTTLFLVEGRSRPEANDEEERVK